jgi:hypothetical protein
MSCGSWPTHSTKLEMGGAASSLSQVEIAQAISSGLGSGIEGHGGDMNIRTHGHRGDGNWDGHRGSSGSGL